jgi:hypothetical protein
VAVGHGAVLIRKAFPMSTPPFAVPDDIAAAGWTLKDDDPALTPDPETLEETTGLVTVELVRAADGEVRVGQGASPEEAMRNATGLAHP